MAERQHGRYFVWSARVALASIAIAGGAMAAAGQSAGDPVGPLPSPDPAIVPPGQPVAAPLPEGVAPPPAPVPAGPPPVPEISNPVYGAGQTPGQFGYLRDLWHASRSSNPLEALAAMDGGVPTAGPPAGAGPAPKLPPGFTSLTAPESSTPATQRDPADAPPLPPGYYPLTGPPPPGYFDTPDESAAPLFPTPPA